MQNESTDSLFAMIIALINSARRACALKLFRGIETVVKIQAR
jgi:hypothetical protein